MDHLEQLRDAKESLRHYREIHAKASYEAARLEEILRTQTTTVAALIKSAPDQELDLNADSTDHLMQYWKARYAKVCRERKVTAGQLSQAQKHCDQTRKEMFAFVEIIFDLERQIEKEANKGKSHETDFRGFPKAQQDETQDHPDREDASSRRGSTSSQSESEIFRKDRNRSRSRRYWKAYRESTPQPKSSQKDGDRSKPQKDQEPHQQSTPEPKPSQKDGDRSEKRNHWKPPRPSTPHPMPSQKPRNLAPFNQYSAPSAHTLFPTRVRQWYRQTTEIFPRYHELTAFPAPPVQGPCAKLSCRQNPGALAPACRCSIRAAFLLVPDLDLKKERTRWHPDKFSGCAETLRENFQQKAKEIFVVVEEMYDAAQKGRY